MYFFQIFFGLIILSFGKYYFKDVTAISVQSRLARFILESVMFFKIDTKSIESMPSKIVLITSHTSFYDGIISILLLYGYLYRKYQVNILVKKEFAKYFKFFNNRYLNTISVDRNKKYNIVDNICEQMKDKDNYIIALAPEGTRSYTTKVRTGFWFISEKLNIPFSFVGIDFKYKFITFTDPRSVKDLDEDIEWFKNQCNCYIPLYPDRCAFHKNNSI